ncbi:(deoxy)nucleoside triphosphate pyrophosphohydrolase [Desulfohalobium retbaense]|uniref:8-oxo-dGTP diphosphatase n=1 Tax=Desulfohalobium retbaense (strain ATCC 49708 / DSM 5692 / JCM 16813 / HR100) TaxID=485915 RepID=C8X267_DESRD|nr:(deoxy)nucleoside triphosphate pyrophosphohydrolase [Desulfohalobium retbaense]ACV68390.1 NUDIX hydrolase [Desulfohalobium retbaense DSM 5692]
MPEETKLLKVVAGIVLRGRTALFAQRPAGKSYAGQWEFPGGKAEPGECLCEALQRELMEELRIRPLKFRLWKAITKSYTRTRIRLYFYIIPEFEGTPNACEGQQIAWLLPQHALDLPLLAADVPIVRALAFEIERC